MAATLCLAWLLALVAARAAPARAQGLVAGPRNSALGLAHVDVADLHVVRKPDGPPSLIESLSAADLADRYARASALGTEWHRWSIYWDLADRGGTFDWAVSDGMAARDVGSGLRSLVVLHGNPPGVAHVTGAPADLTAPVFLSADGRPTDDPAAASAINPGNTFGRFVAASVQRYRPGGDLASERGWAGAQGVRAWQIGNEPNSKSFWAGSPAEYARLLEVGYLAAKWVDPTAVVAHAGIANDGNAEVWFGQFLDALRSRAASSPLPALHGYYYDRTAWHWYTAPANLTAGTPARVRQMQVERGLPAKPFWVTEYGAAVWSEYPGPCWDPSSPGRVTPAEQAAFVWQSVADGLAAGAQLMVYFQLYDDCGNGHRSYDAFGLVRNHAGNQCWEHPGQSCWVLDTAHAGRPRPAYEALRVVAKELAGARLAGTGGHPSSYRVVAFAQGGDKRVTLAWSNTRRDRVISIHASSPQATLYELDADGNVRTRTVRAVGGRHSLRLAAATNRNAHTGGAIAAGRPVLLVETGPGVAGSAAGLAVGESAGAPMSGQSEPGRSAVLDATPPVIALVGELPPESPPLFELQVLAADAMSGLDRYQVLYAVGSPPTDPAGWTPHVGELRWPGRPRSGQVRLPFVGAPGRTYFFAAVACDVAGNCTAAPSYAQARTTIVGTPSAGGPPIAEARPRAGFRSR